MKVVILAGGFGTRISEESHLKPKPMIEIGGKPILWHIMKYYSSYGFNEFIICLGYKGEVIKEYFANYYLHKSDITFDFVNNNYSTVHSNLAEPWKVTLVDTGLNTMTGGRIKRVQNFIDGDQFMLTYGDGVSNVDLNALLSFHNQHGRLATLTAIQPGGRYGSLEIASSGEIRSFAEKTKEAGGYINGGFMILNKRVIDLIEDDKTVFERGPLETLATTDQLMAFEHDDFWQCMDTLRDKLYLDELLEKRKAPWVNWE